MDFLRFNTFIAQDVLVFFYYIFAILVPLFLWALRPYIIEKFPAVKTLEKSLSLKSILLFFAIFLCMELCLRMVFEAMIGYFDMHDYLFEIVKSLQGKTL